MGPGSRVSAMLEDYEMHEVSPKDIVKGRAT